MGIPCDILVDHAVTTVVDYRAQEIVKEAEMLVAGADVLRDGSKSGRSRATWRAPYS